MIGTSLTSIENNGCPKEATHLIDICGKNLDRTSNQLTNNNILDHRDLSQQHQYSCTLHLLPHHKVRRNSCNARDASIIYMRNEGDALAFTDIFDENTSIDGNNSGDNPFEADENESVEVKSMKTNSQTILNFVKDHATTDSTNPGVQSSNSNSVHMLSAQLSTTLSNGSVRTKRNQAENVVTDDEDSLETMLDEFFYSQEETMSSVFVGQKRRYDGGADLLLQAISENEAPHKSNSSDRPDAVPYQIEHLDIDKFFHEDDNIVMDELSRSGGDLTLMVTTTDDPSIVRRRNSKRIKLNDGTASSDSNCTVNTTENANRLQQAMCRCMEMSAQTTKSLQEWDRKNGLPKSHSPTMVNSSRSREQLQSGLVLQKWNGVPLLMLPGAKVKVTRRKFRGVKVAELED